MRHPVVCPHGCGPIAVTWTRRRARLEADLHRAVCPNQPRTPASADTLSSFWRCRFVPAGCRWFARYQPGQRDWARQAVTAHERSCERRFTR
jgi:hypothetical protein